MNNLTLIFTYWIPYINFEKGDYVKMLLQRISYLYSTVKYFIIIFPFTSVLWMVALIWQRDRGGRYRIFKGDRRQKGFILYAWSCTSYMPNCEKISNHYIELSAWNRRAVQLCRELREEKIMESSYIKVNRKFLCVSRHWAILWDPLGEFFGLIT